MSGPVMVRLTSEELCDFLVAQGLAVAPGSGDRSLPVAFSGLVGESLPKLPHRAYIVTATGGPGFIAERGLGVQSFQVRSRGKAVVGERRSEAAQDAESLAWQVDGMFMSLTAGTIGSRYVNLVDRVAGPPTFLMVDTARRAHYTGNYLFHVAQSD